MNFLGHCLFSEPTPTGFVGSLWPDFGRRPAPETSSHSLMWHFDQHQLIDKTTDSHPTLEPIRQELRPLFRKTTPIVIDMMLDHHLARNWSNYHPQSLENFAADTYQAMNVFNEQPIPERLEKTLMWMTRHNWFVSYRSAEGVLQALEGMSRRIRFNNPIIENRQHAIDATLKFENLLDKYVLHLIKTLPARDSTY